MKFSLKSFRACAVLLPLLALAACGGPSRSDVQAALDKGMQQFMNTENDLSQQLLGGPNPMMPKSMKIEVVDSKCQISSEDSSVYNCTVTLKNAEGSINELPVPMKKVDGHWVVLNN